MKLRMTIDHLAIERACIETARNAVAAGNVRDDDYPDAEDAEFFRADNAIYPLVGDTGIIVEVDTETGTAVIVKE